MVVVTGNESGENQAYHIEVMSINEGSEQASAAPEKALKTASCVKFFAVACSMRKNPHMKMLTPRYLAIGNLCIMKFVGTSMSEY